MTHPFPSSLPRGGGAGPPRARAAASGRDRRPAGFTLVELISVIVIVAVVSAVCVTSLASLGNTRAAAAARGVQHDVSYAREVALNTGFRTWARFDVKSQSYSLHIEGAAEPGRDNAVSLNDPTTGYDYVRALDVNESVGVTMELVKFDGEAEVGFDWMGAPLNIQELPLSKPGSLLLTTGAGIAVEPGTGTITLVQGH